MGAQGVQGIGGGNVMNCDSEFCGSLTVIVPGVQGASGIPVGLSNHPTTAANHVRELQARLGRQARLAQGTLWL